MAVSVHATTRRVCAGLVTAAFPAPDPPRAIQRRIVKTAPRFPRPTASGWGGGPCEEETFGPGGYHLATSYRTWVSDNNENGYGRGLGRAGAGAAVRAAPGLDNK